MNKKTKVYRIVLLHIDHDDIGSDQLKCLLEECSLGNHITAGSVMSVEEAEVEWDDDHPLNEHATQEQEFRVLFPDPIVQQLLDSHPKLNGQTEREYISDLRHWADTTYDQLKRMLR